MMTGIDKKSRERVQAKSRELGHCVCTPPLDEGGKPCLCYELVTMDVCRCAGEQPKKSFGNKSAYTQKKVDEKWRGYLRGDWNKMDHDEICRHMAAIIGSKETPNLERLTLIDPAMGGYADAFPIYLDDIMIVHVEWDRGVYENDFFGVKDGAMMTRNETIGCLEEIQKRKENEKKEE